MVAELKRLVLVALSIPSLLVLETASTVLAASLVSSAKIESGSRLPPRRLLLQTLRLAHPATFPYR